MLKQGYRAPAIRSLVTKPDGKTNPCVRAVRDTLAHHEKDPSWRGENPAGPARNSVIDPVQRKKVIQLVFKKRGRAIVTVKFIQKSIPALRAVWPNRLVSYCDRPSCHLCTKASKKWPPSSPVCVYYYMPLTREVESPPFFAGVPGGPRELSGSPRKGPHCMWWGPPHYSQGSPGTLANCLHRWKAVERDLREVHGVKVWSSVYLLL